MNIGYSSRLDYDQQAYDDRLQESTDPLSYQLDTNRIHNCNECLSTFGPRSSYMGNGVSTTVGHSVATSQQLVDIESILSNRNVPLSKTRAGQVNPIDVTKYDMKHAKLCNDYLDPASTRLTDPSKNYREMSINRFYDLPRNPQANIFYSFAKNTKLEAKDNYKQRKPNVRDTSRAIAAENQNSVQNFQAYKNPTVSRRML